MDLFSTNYLAGVVQELRTPPSFLLDTAFPTTLEDPSEEIHFDIDEKKPRLTAFVSPFIAGKVVEDRGFKTATFKPAYAKDKRRWNPNRPLKRVIGEKLGGAMSPEQRIQFLVGQTLEDQLDMLTRREEVMAAEALRLGQVTVAGEGFATQVVSFGRHANLRSVKTGAARWSQSGADPLQQIEDMATTMQGISGAVVSKVVMAPDAYSAFKARVKANDDWKLLVDYRRASEGSRMDLAPGNGEKARLIGVLGMIEYWVYNDVYIDPVDGQTKNLMPSGEVLLLSNDIEGTRCYAAIQDEKANYKATRYFPKSWLEEDPAVRWMLMQSAPLMVPFRPNATASLEVLNGGA